MDFCVTIKSSWYWHSKSKCTLSRYAYMYCIPAYSIYMSIALQPAHKILKKQHRIGCPAAEPAVCINSFFFFLFIFLSFSFVFYCYLCTNFRVCMSFSHKLLKCKQAALLQRFHDKLHNILALDLDSKVCFSG